MNNLKVLVFSAAMLFVPVSANAQTAYTAETVPLHAGPAQDYPVVAILARGFAVSVLGCVEDYSWCDVTAGPHRGWLYARDIVYSYQGAHIPLIDYGAAVGIGVVTFAIGHYWQNHYVGRPWYKQMPHWRHSPPHAAIPPRPPHIGLRQGATRRPAPAYRSPQWQAGAGFNPRPLQAGPRARSERRPAPAYRPVQRPPSPSANPWPARRIANPGSGQGPKPGPSRGSRSRQ